MSSDSDNFKFNVYTFGFKHGAPSELLDNGGGFVLDCRCLPNPYWIDELSSQTGLDVEVEEYFGKFEEVTDFIDGSIGMIDLYLRIDSAKKNPTSDETNIFFACTGGKHRSVYVAERVAEKLKQRKFNVSTRHLHVGLN